MFKRFFIKSQNDLELVAAYKKSGDSIYLGELFKRYSDFMFYVAMKYFRDSDKSKDAVMQVTEKLISELEKHEISNFKSWLHVVVKNHCLMQLRSLQAKEKIIDITEKNLFQFMECVAEPHHEDIELNEKKLELLSIAIEELDEEQKKCIDYFYLQQKSYVEISEIEGYNLNQVKSYIQNGKRNLKMTLEKLYEKEGI